MAKKDEVKKVVEVYNDKQYKDAKARGDVVIDRRGMTQYERSGKSEPMEIPGVSDAGNEE